MRRSISLYNCACLARPGESGTNDVRKVMEGIKGAFETYPAQIDLITDGRLLHEATDQL